MNAIIGVLRAIAGDLSSLLAPIFILALLAAKIAGAAFLAYWSYRRPPKDAYEAAWLAIACSALAYVLAMAK